MNEGNEVYLHGLEHGFSSIPWVVSFSPPASDTFMVAQRDSRFLSSCVDYSRSSSSSIFGELVHELNAPIRKPSQDWLTGFSQLVFMTD